MREIGGIRFYDTLPEIVAPSHSALVVVDMQNDFVSPGGHFARHGRAVERIQGIVPSVRALVDAARAAGVLIVYCRQTTLPALASDSPAWVYFKTRDGKSPDYTIAGSWGADFVVELAPPPEAIIVDKHRPSAFHETTLDAVLRDHQVETIVVAGCVTQGCVQATVTDGSYHDYYAVVVKDCVESTNSEQHDTALRFLASRYDMVSLDQIVTLWAKDGGG